MRGHSYFDDGNQDIIPIETSLPIHRLREAIQTNRVSYPVPAPIFSCEYRADVQWRLAELYFVRGWNPMRLAERYRISSARVRQSLRSWVRRAAKHGYLQPIPLDSAHEQRLTPDDNSAFLTDDPPGHADNLADKLPAALAPMPQVFQPRA